MSLMEIDNPASPIMAITPVPPSEYSEPHPDDEQPSNRRRKKSIVWEHFTIENVGPGCMRAVCNQCKKSFAYITGLKLAGTSHLKRHIALGICPVSRQKGEVTPHTPNMSSGPPKKRPRVSPGYVNLPFDQNRCTLELAKMIIQHDYPLHIVEHPAFVEFVKTLQPQYSMVSFNTIEGECVGIYLREKQYLLDLISGNPARVNLTLDLATSNHGIGYAFITGHFIDRDWNLQRLLLNVIVVPFPDSDYAFNRAIVSCLTDWHLESKLFTLTLDRSFSSDTMTGNLRGMLSVRNPLVLNGQLLQGSCFARVLSRLAQDVIWSMGDIVKRIRQSVKYVKTSEAYDEKFAELRQQLQVPSTRELVLDNPTKWNTTYDMLVAACELKEVFSCMDPSDPVYNINLNPSIDDWKRVEVLCTYLKLFFDAANFLTSAAHPLANSFYHEVSKIQLELNHAALSQDPIVSNLTRPLKEKFDQYWKEVFLVLALAVVMDPRFKMKLIEFSFSRIFGEEAGTWVKTVDDGIHELFYDYIAPHYFLPAAPSVEGDMVISHFEAPEDVEMAPQDMPSQVVAQEVAHQQEGVTFQERQTREIPPPEMNHQDVSSTEVDNQELSIYDVTTQQMHTQEIPEELPQEIRADELKPEEMHNQEVLQQEMQADTVPSRDSQVETVVPENIQDRAVTPQLIEPDTMPSAGGIQAEAAASLETKAGSVPSQDMQAETVVPQHIQDEVGISQDVQSLGVTSEEMQTEAVPPQEVISEVDQIESGEVPLLEVQTEAKSVPPVEVQKKSVEVPLPEVQTEAEAVAPLEVQTKSDAIPSEELQAEGEVLPKEKVESEVEAVAPQEVQAEPISTEALPLQEMQSEVVQSQDAQAEAVPTGEVQAEAVPLQDEQVEAVVPQDVQKDEAMAQEEKQNEEVPAEKVHAWEETAKDLNNHNERPKEMNSQTIPPAEVDVQEVPPPQDEVQPQEMETKEVPSQEEVQPHAMETEEVATQEMDIQEVKQHEGHIEDGTKEPPPLAENSTQAESPQEKQNQEALPEDVHAEGLLSEDAQAPDVVSHDMQTQEKQPEDLRSNGVDVIEKQPEDLHNKDGSLQRMESQGLPQMTVNKELPQEVQHQEMPTQEAQSQEMQPQMLSQDTHSQGLHSQDMPMISIADGLSDFDVYISEITSGNKKSELDQYLEESLLPRVQEFDVLDWWKLNKLKYPTLSKLAADILSIPISTVSPDSIFDIENKTIHQYQSSLRSVTLEALICAKDWLQHGPSTPKFANALVKME